MNITDITTKSGAHRRRKRVGRGESSGHGKTCGRGNKGAGARAGYNAWSLSEGGMFPLFRRLPKFGFSNAFFRQAYQVVNLRDLQKRFEDGGHVTAASLEACGLIQDRKRLVKVLGDGELTKKLTVEAHRFSAQAAARVEAAGGKVVWLSPPPKKKFVKRPPAKPAAESAEKQGKHSASKKEGGSKGKKAPAPPADAPSGEESAS